MNGHIRTMLDRMANLIHSGDYEGVADYFVTPFSLHTQDEVLVFRSRLAFTQALQTIVARHRADRVQALRWHLSAQEIVRDHRCRLWVRWDHIHTDKTVTGAMNNTYYCRIEGDRICIEMVQYQTRPAHITAMAAFRPLQSQ